MKNNIPEKVHQGGDGKSQDEKEDKIKKYALDFQLTPPFYIDNLTFGENKMLNEFCCCRLFVDQYHNAPVLGSSLTS